MKNTSTTFAYLRVSTNDQDLAKNKKDILLLAHSKNLGRVQFVEEIVSGKVNWRERKLGSIIADAKNGDSLIVSELSRLGRSMLECMEILSLASQKGLQIFAVKGNWHLDGTIQSKIIAMAFSMAAEIERDLISQRTTEALRAKKSAGIKLGRPKGPGRSKLDQHRPEIEALLNNGATQAFIAERYQTSRVNMHKWLSKHELNRRAM